MKTFLAKYLKKFAYFIFLCFVCLTLLEVCFRFQLIDFYQAELKGLNKEEQLSSKGDHILVFGDSFSAHPDSYVKHLREKLPQFNFINSAIPGTGVKQHELIFKKRIDRFQPKAIIYQFYVGNDFTDIEHPINFKELSFLRNVFWMVSEQFLVLQYINHRLAFLNTNNQPIKKLQETEFSEMLYNQRVKTYYQADSAALNNTILLKGEPSNKIYGIWKKKIDKMKELTGDSIPVFLLIVPHNAQLSESHLERNRKLRATISPAILNPTFPLVEQMKKDFNTWKIINPLAVFQSLKEQDLYYQNDPHLTVFGQEQLGGIVLEKLTLHGK